MFSEVKQEAERSNTNPHSELWSACSTSSLIHSLTKHSGGLINFHSLTTAVWNECGSLLSAQSVIPWLGMWSPDVVHQADVAVPGRGLEEFCTRP